MRFPERGQHARHDLVRAEPARVDHDVRAPIVGLARAVECFQLLGGPAREHRPVCRPARPLVEVGEVAGEPHDGAERPEGLHAPLAARETAARRDHVARLQLEGDVIATGGGLPCREGRMEALRALGTVVWLAGDLADLCERAGRSGDRPMLAGRSAEELRALYRAREPYYRRAHIVIDTSGLGPDQVVARVLIALRGTRAACVPRSAIRTRASVWPRGRSSAMG